MKHNYTVKQQEEEKTRLKRCREESNKNDNQYITFIYFKFPLRELT